MKILFILLLTATMVCCAMQASAQDGNNSSYYLSNLPQRVRLNPSYQPEYKTWVGLPGLSGISVNYLNTSFSVKDVIRKRQYNDSLYFDMNKFYKNLRHNNSIFFNNENSILTVGVKAKSWYVTFDITQKNELALNLDRQLFKFLKAGNTPYIGRNMDLGGIGLKGSVYSEVAVGLSKKINDKLTVGARLKYLVGTGNVDIKESEISIETSNDISALRLRSKQDIRISAPVDITYTKTGQYVDWDDIDFDTDDIAFSDILNTKNTGFGIDLGAEYKFNEKINFYASILDLGFIRWAGNNYRFHQNTSFDWKGADISHSLNEDHPDYVDIGDAFDDLVDSLKDNFRLMDDDGAYTTMLTSKMYLGATYEFNKMLSFGGIAKFSLMDKRIYPSFVASANARLLRNVSASVSYGIMPGNYTDLGVAITAKLGPVQLYAATDNVLSANYTSTRSVSAKFGINLLFGHVDKKKKDKKKSKSAELIPPPVVKKVEVADTVQEEVKAEEPVQVAESKVLPEPQPEEVKVDSNVTEEIYYVVIGSFQERKWADRQVKMFTKAGFTEANVMLGENGMYRVCLLSFTNQKEAEVVVTELRKKYPQHADAWVLERSTEKKVF
ncbi:DUF5723 family protein [Porphyromonadaceae bacterium OttesenSCG-928-L07]|nr:DUF5723 family protein [Porphyromonadaceae bacterium OttesenSCG-928-L07]MDL2251530.1 DUF5723 family protein [Odoribacter sp. OttesenSCG-928-J03]